jgi:hypothetical protein
MKEPTNKEVFELIRDMGLKLSEQPRFVWPDELKKRYNKITKHLTK